MIKKKGKNNKIKQISIHDLEKALSDLKINKSRDPDGYINELFKNNIIGQNLKLSVVMLFNCLIKEGKFNSFMRRSNITTIHKKGSMLELRNSRGVSRVSVVRSIFMRILYNLKYDNIDRNMSDGQMGGRKNKGCRNNLFIINGIIYNTLRSKHAKPVTLQIYDYAQMFDGIQLEQAIIDMYDCSLKDESLALLYEANKEVDIAIKTDYGLSEIQTVDSIVLQGDTWASLLASVQVDSIAKVCRDSGYGYLYMNELQLSNLGLVDDFLGITEANYQAQQMNSIFNIRTAEKSLQFGPDKCVSMFIGKNNDLDLCGTLKVDKWSVKCVDNKFDGSNQLVESFDGQVNMKRVDEWPYLGFVISNKDNNMSNIWKSKLTSVPTIKSIFMR